MNNNRKISTERNDKDRIELAAAAAKNSDKLAFVELIGIFSPYISALARSFGLPESEYDDLCQVGRIALYRAVCTYNSDKASFATFSRVCIKNAMTSFVRSYKSKARLSQGTLAFEELTDESIAAADGGSTPEDFVLAEEFIKELESAMSTVLSAFEKKVLEYKLSGIGIAEISVLVGKDTKSVENTLFRVRRKLKKSLEN